MLSDNKIKKLTNKQKIMLKIQEYIRKMKRSTVQQIFFGKNLEIFLQQQEVWNPWDLCFIFKEY